VKLINKDMFFTQKREILYKHIPLDTPFSIQIEPSSLCNIRCKYCMHGSNIPNNITSVKRVMTKEQFREILLQLKQFPNKLKTLVLNGMGEPLTNPHIVDFVAMAKEADVAEKVEFFTNALLLSKKLSNRFASAGLDVMKVSLQGMDSDTYRDICGVACDFEKLYENLQYYSIIRTGQLLIKIIDIGLNGNEDLFLEKFGPLANMVNVERVRPWYQEYIRYDGMCERGVTKYGTEIIEREVCPIPFMRMLVRVNGDVSPCYAHLFPFKEKMNCFEQSLKEIWNGEIRRNFLCKMLSETYRSSPICADCQLRNENSFSESDNLDPYRDVLIQRLIKI